MKKLLSLEVRRGPYESTNGGVSSTHDTLYIEHENGHIDPSKVNPALIFTLDMQYATAGYYRLMPVVKCNSKTHCGDMYGGNIATCSHPSLVGKALRIHDRSETHEMNAHLSI